MAEGDDDYDEAAERFEGHVPPNINDQTQIRDYIENEIGIDQNIDRKDKLLDELSDRISDSRGGGGETGGFDLSDSERFVFSADRGKWQDTAGRWRDSDGQFTDAPDE